MSSVAIARISEAAHELPVGSKIGVAVMVVGLAADVVAHLDPAFDHRPGVTGPELSAHLVVFLGMALVLIGVLVDGVRAARRSARDAPTERR